MLATGTGGRIDVFDADTLKPLWRQISLDEKSVFSFSAAGQIIDSTEGAEDHFVYVVVRENKLDILERDEFMALLNDGTRTSNAEGEQP